MRTFVTLLRASVTMLRRDVTLILTSLGLAVISIFAFGWLLGGSGVVKPDLGVVNQDAGSPATAQIVQQLQQNSALIVHVGSQAGEMDALRHANRNAVIVLPAGFSAALQLGDATLQVTYDQSSPTSWLIARDAVSSIVAGLSSAKPAVSVQETAISVHDLSQVDFLTPGMLGMMLMWANLSVGTVLVTWRGQGILRRLAATPLRPITLIGAQMLARLILSLAQGALVMGIAILVFHVQMVGSWLAVGVLVTLGTLAMLAVGFVIGSFARTAEAANGITFMISFPMMFLSGSYFPVDNAPAFLKPVTTALPLTHLNDALRQVINQGASLGAVQGDALVLAAWAVVGVVLATRAFRWA